jgi:hypothetical protein
MKPNPNKPAAGNAGIASRLIIGDHWPGVPEPGRSKAQIELEIWEGPLSKRVRLSEATPRALREALLRLDGSRTDCLWIEIEGVGALSIGGGPSGFVVVSFPSDGSSSHVVTGDAGGTTVELQVGGQTGIYAAAMVLPATVAFDIAGRFLVSGVFDSVLKWVEDCPAE